MHTLDNFEPCIFFKIATVLIHNNLKVSNPVGEKMHGSNNNFEPCIFIYWIILHKNLKVSNPIGKKCMGQMPIMNHAFSVYCQVL